MRPLHFPIWTSTSSISISDPSPCSWFPYHVFTCTTVVSSSVWHFFLPHHHRPRIRPWWRCCEYQPFLCCATWKQLSCHLCPNTPTQCPYFSSPRFRSHQVLSVLWHRSLSWGLPPLCLFPLPSLHSRTPSDCLSIHPMRPMQPMGT